MRCTGVACLADCPCERLARGVRLESPDKMGATLSIACAMHCVLMPIGIGLLAASGLQWIADARVEYTLLAMTVLIASTTLIASYRRRHGKRRCLVMFVVGLS